MRWENFYIFSYTSNLIAFAVVLTLISTTSSFAQSTSAATEEPPV
jgi:hypothetical protein